MKEKGRIEKTRGEWGESKRFKKGREAKRESERENERKGRMGKKEGVGREREKARRKKGREAKRERV